MKKYKKMFKEWSNEKEEIHFTDNQEKFFPKVREIFYAKIGVNIGFESDGKDFFLRPVIVLAKIGSLYWVAPLTSKFKDNIFHHKVTSIKFSNIEDSLIMLSQARIFDKKRLEESIGMVSIEEFNEIQKKMKKLYFPSF